MALKQALLPADADQMTAVIEKVFFQRGLRFCLFHPCQSAKNPEGDGSLFYGEGYKFTPGKDEIIRKGTAGYIVTFGDMVYRSLDAVERLRKEGLDVGLINKVTLNVVDEDAIKEYGSKGFLWLSNR